MSLLIVGGIVGVIILICIAIAISGFRTIRPTERGLIERFGKYNRFAKSGLNWLIPFGIEKMYQVNITETMVDAQPQEIITKDKLNAMVDAQVYYKVKTDEQNVKNSIYNVNNCKVQIVSLARTTLRNIFGNMNLNEANSQRDVINNQLLQTLIKETGNWGIDIVRTELKEISPPKDVQETMNKVVKAENEKQAAVDYATATETQADGQRRAIIKEAEGAAQAITIKATAEATAIKLVNESATKYFVGQAVELKRLEVMQTSLKDNSKIIFVEKGIRPMMLFGDLGGLSGKTDKQGMIDSLFDEKGKRK